MPISLRPKYCFTLPPSVPKLDQSKDLWIDDCPCGIAMEFNYEKILQSVLKLLHILHVCLLELTRTKISMQRNFEDRLGKRIEEMGDSQNSRSDKLGVSLQHVQADMQYLAGRLQEIAAGIQRLEVKLDRISEGGASRKNQQWPQQCDIESPDDLKKDSMTSIGSESSNTGRGKQYTRYTARADNVAETVDVQREFCRKQSSQSKLAAKISVDALAKIEAELQLAQSLVPDDMHGEENQTMPKGQPEAADTQHPLLLGLETKIGAIDKRLERISASMKIKSDANDGDDEEDRRRLKEKLKVAIEVDRRSRVHTIVSQSEMWLEFIFGICSPDQRIGKRGSRCWMPPARLRLLQLGLLSVFLFREHSVFFFIVQAHPP